MRAHRPLFAALATLALGLVAAAPLASARELAMDVYLHEVGARFHILPPDINAEVGDVLKLNVTNAGASAHDLLVCGEAPKPQSTCGNVLGQTRKLNTRESEIIQVELKEPGKFEYFGTGFGEKAANMSGRLHVTGEVPSKGLPLGPLAAVGGLAIAATLFLRRRGE